MKNKQHTRWQTKFTQFLNGDLGRALEVAPQASAGSNGKNIGQAVKKGMASFYVVIFAILVFIVLVLAFINIMVSETLQSSGSDLSASALDSAQAGVEDAKTAIMQCLSSNGNNSLTASTACGQLFSDDNCGALASYLYGSTEAEVSVGDTSLNQAYTCVTLDNQVESLRATLSPNDSNGSLFIVPLYRAGETYNSVQVSWYSETDQQGTSANLLDSIVFPKRADMATNVPMIQVQMISADTSAGSAAGIANTARDRGAAVLVPIADGGTTSGDVHFNGNSTTLGGVQVKKDFNTEGSNNAVGVSCNNENGYACNYTLTGSVGEVSYLIITNPYNDREVSVEVKACTGGNCNDGNTAEFTNVQIEVDSTGRASDYYRRIQTRLTLADPDVPVPTYALNLGGTGALTKKFAVTRNCWRVQNNELKSCNNGISL